jgi:hypothetical protein
VSAIALIAGGASLAVHLHRWAHLRMTALLNGLAV